MHAAASQAATRSWGCSQGARRSDAVPHRVTTSAAMWSCRKWSRWLSTAHRKEERGGMRGETTNAWCRGAEKGCAGHCQWEGGGARRCSKQRSCMTARAAPAAGTQPASRNAGSARPRYGSRCACRYGSRGATHLAAAQTGTSCSTPSWGRDTSARSCGEGGWWQGASRVEGPQPARTACRTHLLCNASWRRGPRAARPHKAAPCAHMPCSSVSGREARPIICSKSVTG